LHHVTQPAPPPATAGGMLSPQHIAARLALPPPPPDPRDLHAISLGEEGVLREAAVLVPLVARATGLTLLLTQRTAHLSGHPGQISFPGGGVERGDLSREDTALREAEEEIGLPRSCVSVLGRLANYDVVSGFRITPVVGWVQPPFDLVADEYEVASVFEVPLAHFLNPANYTRHETFFEGRHRHYLAAPYEGRYIWGATAGMLYCLCRTLAG